MFKIFKNNIIDALKALSNYDFQRVAWFNNDEGLSYSYNENVLDLFYDSTLDDALKAGKVVFGKEADEALINLEKLTDRIDGDEYSEEVLIGLSEMQSIRKKAAEALALVLSSDLSESTVEIVE